MPTLNLGRVRFNWKGAYDPLVAYLKYDVATSDGQSYVCIADVTGTGPHDVSGATYWDGALLRGADYNAARDEAVQAATDASNSAAAAGNSETAAGTSAANADSSEAKSDRWANEAEDIEVEVGKFSSYHWMKKAEAFGDPNQFNITADQTLDTRTMAQWAAQSLDTEQALNGHEVAADPHTQYYNQARGDIRYVKLSGANDFDTMPSVGGAPIVESGSNSAGEWTKWADGTQMCRVVSLTMPIDYSVNSTTVAGMGYSDPKEWVYPAPFSIQPTVTATAMRGINDIRKGFIHSLSNTVTSANLVLVLTSNDSAIGISASITAYGPWK